MNLQVRSKEPPQAPRPQHPITRSLQLLSQHLHFQPNDSMQMVSEKDPEHALRARDSKRRHRARQKEHTARLEQRLRELQHEGVQATIEVQLSARKVVQENQRLRALLRHVRVDEETINSWAAAETEDNHEGLSGLLEKPCSGGGAIGRNCRQAGTATNFGGFRQDEREILGAPSPGAPPEQVHIFHPGQAGLEHDKSSANGLPQPVTELPPLIRDGPRTEDDPSPSAENHYSDSQAGHKRCQSSPGSIPISPRPGPCKLLSHLAANPNAHITQMDLASEDEELDPNCAAGDNGVPCSRAYKMLMHYATTEPKLDAVAHVLEKGCVANTGPGGGCRVGNAAIWQALDDLCL